MHERILLVEDDRDIVDYLGSLLLEEGFVVESVSGQKEAVSLIEEKEYDCLLIDISLSDGNGYAVCSAARQKSGSSKNTSAAVIFLTASGDEYSIVTGLDMGADDYIQKPFRPRELVSRIRSVLRRTGKSNKLLKAENITIDTVKGTVYKNGEELFLSALEYRLLLIFFNNKGAVLSRGRLLQEMWDVAGEFVNDNTLTVYIKRLREKIEDNPSNPQIIKTVRGMGYRL
jgi:DNA-binding response OmpR family regulator